MITTLSQLIAQVETGNNPWAMRYEPAFTVEASAISSAVKAIHPDCSFWTARVILCTSWGKYQIMGENLYAQGLTGWPGEFLADDAHQDMAFLAYVQQNKINLGIDALFHSGDDANIELFARRWNGPGNIDAYVARMKQVYAESANGPA